MKATLSEIKMNNPHPLVSILVNCYNGEEFLKEALDSIYDQTYQNFEILLIDNCSTDKTPIIAKQYDHRLKYIRNEKPIPLYSSRNIGLKYVTGDYIAFLDSDDKWLPFKLDEQIKLMEKGHLDFVYSNYKNLVEHRSPLKKQLISIYLNLLKFNLYFRKNKFIPTVQVIKNYDINLQTVMVRKDLIKDLKFNERMNLYGDYEFFLKLLLLNNKLPYYMSQPTSFSRVHERQLSRKSYANWLREAKICYHSLAKHMKQNEKINFIRVNILFHTSNIYMEKKNYIKALKIKANLSLNSPSHFMHFFKTVLTILIGNKIES